MSRNLLGRRDVCMAAAGTAVLAACNDGDRAAGSAEPGRPAYPNAEQLTQELVRGMPWEHVRAKVIHARLIQAVTVRATVRLQCPSIRLVDGAPVPKDTGMREFRRLDLIEVDRLEAHHIEAAEIRADEIVATRVDAPGR